MSAPAISVRCGTCRHWLAVNQINDLGTCKRYPPTIDPASFQQALPTMHKNDWCGEHKAP